MSLPVIPSAHARNDVFEIYLWYADNGGIELADRFQASYDRAIRDIAENPGIGSPKEFENPSMQDIRKWNVPGFSRVMIFYRVDDDRIRIMRVLEGHRDIKSLFDGE